MGEIFSKIQNASIDDVVKSIQKVIQIKGFSGTEKDRIKYMMKIARKLKYNRIYTDELGNLIAEMRFGNGKGPKVIFTGHMDVVGADEREWDKETPPFGGVIKDGKIYGRGASDMLSADVAMLYAIGILKSFNPENLNGTAYFVGSVCEEFFEGVAFLETLKKIQPDYVVIGESTDKKLNIGQRGRLEVEITAYGISIHSAKGKTVYNAIEQAAELINKIYNEFEEDEDELLGKRIIVPTDIKIPVGGGGGLDGRGGNSTVPNRVIVNYDMRTLVQDSEESIMELMSKYIKPMEEKYSKLFNNYKAPTIRYASDGIKTYTGVLIEQIKFAPAWKMNRDASIVQKSLEGLKKVGIDNVEISAYSFCTDGSASIKYKKLFPDKNLELVGYGPGKESLAHIINEYVEIEDVKRVFKAYMGMLYEYLS